MVGKRSLAFVGVTVLAVLMARPGGAVDHFLTIGGGYSAKGNQASMEANVLFFDQLLASRYQPHEYQHHIFFSDGDNPDDDVQELIRPVELSESMRLVSELFDWDTEEITYRNHRIPNIKGANRASEIESHLRDLAGRLDQGDRLFVYVTAHGGKSESDDNSHDTTVYGWQREKFTASQLATWLDDMPPSVPVVMVMAQCYCGGFSHVVFEQADDAGPLAAALRCGFYAQRHDLPAAGCRPDISNDREYSSYFWGAIMGRSRAGETIDAVDRDGDGRVSLAEAHIYAVVASETIDIPLRASDALLRVHSRIGESSAGETPEIAGLSGSLGDLVAEAEFVDRAIVVDLATRLGLQMTDSVDEVQSRANKSTSSRRRGGRRGMAGYKDAVGRLKDEILVRWPEIEKMESFGECGQFGLSPDEMEREITQWDSFKDFSQIVQSRQQSKDSADQNELNRVKLRRLVHALESIVMAKNLAVVADEEVVQRYRQMLELEKISL
jgi:hypothetical protein